MGFKSIQDIIKSVEQPSRYAGAEVNAVIKDHRDKRLSMVLAFPDLYEIGTSHFGIQILYHILNRDPDIVAERVYTPAPDMERLLREHGLPMFSRETKTPLGDFDIIGFSLLYELNYTNALTLLDLAGIPFLAADRGPAHPLIIAGGPCTFNPEPVADLFDAMVVGDGEDVILSMAHVYMDWKSTGALRDDLLRRWSDLPGVYVPSFYVPDFVQSGPDCFQTVRPVPGIPHTVRRAILPDLERAPFPDAPVIPCGRPVHERLRLEISRGCSRGCRFCQAGMIYRPVRERNTDTLLDLTRRAVCRTGYEDLSFLSLSAGDYENLTTLMHALLSDTDHQIHTQGHLSFSLPSIRADRLDEAMMEAVRRVRKTGFTIAPEAGSQRLRDVINKGLTDEDIINTVERAFQLGWTVIKLYFMIGLPMETMEDLEEMVDLVRRLSRLGSVKGKKRQINVSVSTFIPKAHTPFQWERQIDEDESWTRIQWLRDKLSMRNVTFKWGKTQISFLEGLMSRGDRRLTPLIIRAYRKGCRLDGWNEHFRYDLWKESIAEEQIDAAFFSHRSRSLDEPLPWDHIDSGISKQFMIDEKKRSLRGDLTPDCRNGACSGCGICDFDTVMPRIEPLMSDRSKAPAALKTESPSQPSYIKMKCRFQKTGDARFFGHLEMVNTVSKAVRRAGIPVKYTSGHHPIIKLVFSNPLPVGYESLDEFFIIEVHDDFDTNRMPVMLNAQLPDGLHVVESVPVRHKADAIEKPNTLFSVVLTRHDVSSSCVDSFLNEQHVPFEKTNKKGKVTRLDLKEIVHDLKIIDNHTISFEIHPKDGVHVRPEAVVRRIFDLSDDDMAGLDIRKIKHIC
ncbi:TIGR03960 family B12-binding radical SAM protein [Desulfatiferula olefinivorans]